ncbi:MAG TPA: GGDEF domain-containing protein [Deltaproteobacteria bacterium]|nr:GGDEF domain-containing protein [Deltaproteobacteria bacterium]
MTGIIPREDRDQALRIRRFLMAFASYFMWILLVLYCYIQGMFRGSLPLTLQIIAMVITMNLILYGILRSGLNRRFQDPSLTMVQMSLATVWIMVVAYFLNEARGIMFLLYMVVFIFGTFRLRLRQFFKLTVFAMMGYGTLIMLLLIHRPESIDLKLELLYMVTLFTVLLWFSFVGSYINTLRKRLSKSNSELSNALSVIKQQAIHDDLTGVYNRGYLFHILMREKGLADRGESTFSLCIFDLDDFKNVNDTYGHLSGDVVLKTLTQRIENDIRQEDYLARYGGEEFVLILAYPDIHDALACAERIRRLVSEISFPGLPEDFRVTISMGLTRYHPVESIDTLLSRADDALYRAKRSGKNLIECEPAPASFLAAGNETVL